jgi:predicted dehydrogenase
LDGGGVLINQAIHTIDLLYWFLGKVKKVTAHAMTRTHDGIEGEDNAVAILDFENGALATLNASTSVIPAQSRKIELHGTTGTMILEGDVVSWLQKDEVRTEVRKVLPKGADSPLQNFPVEPHRDQFDAIAQAIFKGKQPPVSGAESMQSLAIAQAVYESVRLQKTIFINSLF